MAGPFHFSRQEVAYAAAQGVPLASILVPFSGVLTFAGGLSILMGYRAKLGASLIVVFLVPVTVMMHNFWAVHYPMTAQFLMSMFLTKLSLPGGSSLISQFGAGPCALDARR